MKIVKKVIGCLILVCLLSGCTIETVVPNVTTTKSAIITETPETKSNLTLDYFSADFYNASVMEDDKFVYYIMTDGIYAMDKNSSVKIKLSDLKAKNLYLTETSIYFLVKKQDGTDYEEDSFFVYDEWIYCMDKNGENCRVIFDLNAHASEFPEVFRGGMLVDIQYYFVIDNKVYMSLTLKPYMLDLSSNKLTALFKDKYIDISHFQIVENKMYYMARRLFTIYECNLLNLDNEPQIILGEGKHSPKNLNCSEFVFEQNVFLCHLRLPNEGLYIMQKGVQPALVLGSDYEGFHLRNGQFWFYAQFDDGDYLCQYDFKQNKILKLIPKSYQANYLSNGFAIANGYVYWKDAAGSIHSDSIPK